MQPFGSGLKDSGARISGTRTVNAATTSLSLPAGAGVGELAVIETYQGTTSISGGAGTAWSSHQPTGSNTRIFWRVLEPNDFVNALVFNTATPYAVASIVGGKSVALGVEATSISTPGPSFAGSISGFLRSGGCIGLLEFWQASASAIVFSPALVGVNMSHNDGSYFMSSTLTLDVTQIQDGASIGVQANVASDTRYVGVYQILAG